MNDVVETLENRYQGLAFGARIDVQDEVQLLLSVDRVACRVPRPYNSRFHYVAF